MKLRQIFGVCLFGTCGFFVLATAVCAQTNSASIESAGQGNSTYSLTGTLRQPAVSELNGKVSYEGGNMDSSEGHIFHGSVTFPVAHQFGLQADALYSRISGQDFFGGAGHVFWRDPEFGFIGFAGGGLHQSGVDTFQVGAEGGWYCGRFTFGFFAGVGSIRYDGSAPFIDTSPIRFIGRISADWYALDDLRVGVSYVNAFENNLVKGEVEYQTPINGLALTAEVAGGSNGYDHWLLGLRYYFGTSKSLRDRQRRDDPPGLMPQILHGLGLYGAEANRNAHAYLTAHPDAENVGNWGYGGIEIERDRMKDPVGPGVLPPLPPGPLEPPGDSGPAPSL